MEVANKNIRPTFSGVDFGEAVDSPIVNFITVIDLNQAQIRVPYESFETKVGTLIENYRSITSCKHLLQGEPCFQIMQGTFSGQIAAKQYKISSMGLQNTQAVCFKVLKKAQDYKAKVEQSNVRFSKLKQISIVSVILAIQGKQINYEMNIKDTVSTLKAKLINKVPEFINYTPESIYFLQQNGMFFNEKSLLESYGIQKGAKITAVIKKNTGCFKSNCLITCADNKKVPICQIKAGDIILSYNQQKKSFEEDQVTFVHSSILKESIVIKLTDESEIQTTPNHLFLCDDEEYRMVQFSQKYGQNLKRGSMLKLGNGKEVGIQSITTKIVYPEETFYHLCIENNHNFIVDNFIAHNMLIKIKMPGGQILKKDIDPTQPIIRIKQQLQAMYYTTMQNFKLVFAGKQLKNQRTLSDENISKDSYINLVNKKLQKFNFVAGQTKIMTTKGPLVAISALKSGDQVVIYDLMQKMQSQNAGKVLSVEKTTIKDYIQIYLGQNKTPLLVASDSYLELFNGQVINAKNLSEVSSDSRPYLKGIKGNKITVTKISSKKYPEGRQYFKLKLDNSHNFVAEGVIIHDLVLNIAAMKNNKRQKKISFGAHLLSTIRWAKQRVQQYTGIPFDQQVFTLNDKKLEDGQQILDYQISSSQLIVATQTKSKIKSTMKSSIQIEMLFEQDYTDKNFYLVLSPTEKIVINYHKYSQKTVQEILKQLIPNCKSSYFFLFGELMIFPNQLFSTLQESQNFYLPQNEVLVVKNQKLAFIQNMSIKKSHIQNYGFIKYEQPIYAANNNLENKSEITVQKQEDFTPLFDKAIDKITSNNSLQKQFKKQRFYMPFLYYTSRHYDSSIYKYIRFFEEHKEEVDNEDSVYCIIRNLYINMNLLPNYIGPCVCGMRNFKFSKFFSVDKVFYWHSFTSARKKQTQIVEDLKEESGTLFYINSLAGKDIKTFSLYPDEEQILFPPFSYFLIVKIEKGEDMDKVWLDQIPSPITFQKNIILWVDDFPKNNIRQTNSIMALKDVEILQLTSTIMAEKWVKQFGWLLNWKGLEFKLISDMARYEGLQRVQNKQAGIDLLQRLYNKNGFTVKTLIYCGNVARAKSLANNRKLEASKYYSITEDELVVQKFCQIIQQ